MPIYEYICQGCKHHMELLFFSAEYEPANSFPCPKCGEAVVRVLSPVRVRSVEHKGTPYQHLYDDTVMALGIEDIAVPKSQADNDMDWTERYDPSWEDEE